MENEFLLNPLRINCGAHAPARRRASRVVAIVVALGAALTFGRPTAVAAAEFLLRVGDLQVPAGTAVHGAAIAVGGTVYVDGTVEGDAIALGGNVDVRGHVAGSARADGGSVILHSTAVVDGEAAAVGGRVVREPGATVGGQPSEPAPPAASPPGVERVIPAPLWWWLGGLATGLILMMKSLLWLMYLFFLAGFVGSAWMIALLFPRAVARFGAVLERDPVGAFLMGVLGWPVSFVVAVLLAISIVGLTLVLLVPVTVVAAVMVGTTAVARGIGQRIRPAGTIQEVVVGAVILAVVFSIPGLGWVVGLVVATWGFGAVLLAFLEGRRSPPARPAAPPPPPPALVA